jgi:transposase
MMEIITGVERRRRWSLEEKLRIVAEAEQPGGGIAEIARRYEISRGLLWNGRSQVRRDVLRPEPPPVFLPVRTINKRWRSTAAYGNTAQDDQPLARPDEGPALQNTHAARVSHLANRY